MNPDRANILEFLSHRRGGASMNDFLHAMEVAPHQRKQLKRVLRQLTDEGVLRRSEQGRFTMNEARAAGDSRSPVKPRHWSDPGPETAPSPVAAVRETPAPPRGGDAARPEDFDQPVHRGKTLRSGGSPAEGWSRAGKPAPIPVSPIRGTSGGDSGTRGGKHSGKGRDAGHRGAARGGRDARDSGGARGGRDGGARGGRDARGGKAGGRDGGGPRDRGGRGGAPFRGAPAPATPRTTVPPAAGVVVGRFTRNPEGYGFVAPLDKQGPDLFIPPDAIGSALHGDIVDAMVTQVGADGRRAGRIVGVRERSRAGIPGKFERRGKQGFVIPDDKRLAGDLYIGKKDENGANDGDLVLAEITTPPTRDTFAKGKISRVLGDREDPGVDSDLVLGEFGIQVEFSAGALAEAAGYPDTIPDDERARRRDLTNIRFVTIDGLTAKDFDDAVAVEPLPNGRTRLYVAIADVAHYVRPGSELDKDAWARATSVYLPDRVVPMLPERLSNDICSLKPNEDRLALCAAMDFDANGEVKDYGIDRIVFRSRQRMTYEDVHGILVDRNPHLLDKYRAHLADFERMQGLMEILRKRRFENGSIDFDLPEPTIVLNLQGATTDIVKAPRYISHKIVEEFMLAANVVVARHFAKLDIPLVYRVHDAPDPSRLEQFNDILKVYGISLSEKDIDSPKAVGKVLLRFEGKPEERLINGLMLRAMRQAQYAVDNIGHFGLAFDQYCHFTSPIRRYPDLLVHRAVHAVLEGKKATERYLAYAEETLDDSAANASRQERVAMDAERGSVALKKVRFMRDKVGEIYAGHITGIAKFGMFVELDEIFVEGLVRMDSIGKDDQYEFDEDRHRIVGRRSGRSFKTGDPVTVEVVSCSLERRAIDFRVARKA